jgi:hypothetical protein
VSSVGAATAVALLSRAAQTLGDALWALAGTLLAARAGQPTPPADSLPAETAQPSAAAPTGT